MKILNKRLNQEQFRDYINTLKVKRRIDKVVYHHTSSPIKIWDGSASMLHYYNLYESKGWKSGPHIFIAPDGIWLFTPIGKQGTHAGPKGNKNSIGVEIVGRYFDKPPTDQAIKDNTAMVYNALMERFNLRQEDNYNHKFFDKNNFCSNVITPVWLYKNYVNNIGNQS